MACLFYKSAHRQVEEQPSKRSKKNDEPCWRSVSCMIEHGNLLSAMTHVTTATDLLCATHQIHDTWVASFRTWSLQNCRQSYGRTQTCRNQSNMWNSRKLLHVTLKFETKILRSGEPHQRSPNRSKIWGSVSGRGRVARARCPRSSVEAGQKSVKIKGIWKSNILLTFGK